MSEIEGVIEECEKLLRRHKFKDALELAEKGLAEHGETADLSCLKGQALLGLRQQDACLQALGRAVELGQGRACYLGFLAQAYMYFRDKEQSKEIAAKAMEAKCGDARDWYCRGLSSWVLGKHKESLASYEESLRVDPNFANTWSSKGNVLNELKRHEEALAACEESLRLDPYFAGALINKGNALNGINRHEEALAAYEEALRIDTESPYVWSNKCAALTDLKRYVEALAACEEALGVNPEEAYAWNNKGNALCGLKRYEEALAAYDATLRLDSEIAKAWSNKGVLLLELKRHEEALSAIENALRLDPKDADDWNNKGNILNSLNRPAEALAAYEEALSLAPEFVAAWNNKGAMLATLNRHAEARDAFAEALRLNPKSAIVWRNMGLTLESLNHFEEALEAYEEALRLDPEYTDAWTNKVDALFAINRPIDAFKYFAENLRINPFAYIEDKQLTAVFEAIENGQSVGGVCLVEVGQHLLEDGRNDVALKCFEKALEVDSANAKALSGRASTLYNLERLDQAKEAYEVALSQDQGNAYVAIGLAETFFRLGMTTESSDILKRPPVRGCEIPEVKEQAKALRSVIKKKIKDEIPIELSDMIRLVENVRIATQGRSDALLKGMDDAKKIFDEFVDTKRAAKKSASFFLVLRKWNSYTPILPSTEKKERSVGGGYFLSHNGFGVVIDPGYGFIQNFANAGLRLADIDAIILTHAHNDHTAEFESLLTMIHKYNDQNAGKGGQDRKRFDIYMNLGSFKKFSGFLDLHEDYLGQVRCLAPADAVSLGTAGARDFTFEALPAYHDEILSRNHAIGLRFTVTLTEGDKTDTKCLVLTSDTGLFPLITKEGKNAPDTVKGMEIWKTYLQGTQQQERIDLLVTHVGSIKKEEFTEKITRRRKSALNPGVFYPNHLGMLGTVRVITSLQPTLAVISEFGEEFVSRRDALIDLIRMCIVQLDPEGRICLLPGDLPFEYDIKTGGVYCLRSKDVVSIGDIECEYLMSGNVKSTCFDKVCCDVFVYVHRDKKKGLNAEVGDRYGDILLGEYAEWLNNRMSPNRKKSCWYLNETPQDASTSSVSPSGAPKS